MLNKPAVMLAAIVAFALASPGEAAQTCLSESEIPSTTPTARFVDHEDGTVTDQATGLMWAQCAAGLSGADCASDSVTTVTWQGALVLAGGSGHAGYTDWRLPNVNELRSIVEQRCVDPAINLAVFPNTPASNFWSASPNATDSHSAWFVYFHDGRAHNGSPRGDLNRVRLVRSGQ